MPASSVGDDGRAILIRGAAGGASDGKAALAVAAGPGPWLLELLLLWLLLLGPPLTLPPSTPPSAGGWPAKQTGWECTEASGS
mmetsp:Transcript_89670/g.254229  ORF Transcript_89670/g.254229 Transcript_89670/m.254229 type:complete len:83 (-) Transcript_89670:327-575(-)